MALADLFIGELGAEGTRPALTLIGFGMSVYGFVGGCRAIGAIDVSWITRELLPARVYAEAVLFMVVQVGLSFVYFHSSLPIDHPLYVALAALTFLVAVVNGRLGRRLAHW